MTETTTDVAYDDIPAQPRGVLDEVYDNAGAGLWWNGRNKMFGNLRPRDVYRTGQGGETRVMTVLNMLADGNF